MHFLILEETTTTFKFSLISKSMNIRFGLKRQKERKRQRIGKEKERKEK